MDRLHCKIRQLILIGLLLLPEILTGQSTSGFDILTERYVDRPVTMHRGQIQFNTGYDYSILNRKYDIEGNPIDLQTEGSASAGHSFPFNLKYGILDFIQLSTSIRYTSMGVRSQNQVIYTGVGNISSREIQSYKGLDDLFIGIDIRDPLKIELFDLVLSGGISLPLFEHKPDQPTHMVYVPEPYPGGLDVEYFYNNKIGMGIPISSLGGSLKMRSTNFSATAMISFYSGLKEGESIKWESRLSNGEILYREVPYQYGIGNTIDYNIGLAWQAIDWFAVLVSLEGFRNTGAWSTETGRKVMQGDIILQSLAFGYDIQVSPSLRLSQHLLQPISGKNIMAPRIFQTGISLNFIAGGTRQ